MVAEQLACMLATSYSSFWCEQAIRATNSWLWLKKGMHLTANMFFDYSHMQQFLKINF